jgi:shikimate kinase
MGSDRLEACLKIFLVGLPGTGKSTVGKVLARHLGLCFVDTDLVIERRVECSVRAYFDTHGESAFRDVEARVVEETALNRVPTVVATGGGVVLRSENRQCLHESGVVVYLRSSPEELARRLRHDQRRPLLQGGDVLDRLRQLYAQRDPLYRETAHFVIEAQRPSVQAMTNMVLMQLELAGVIPSHP